METRITLKAINEELARIGAAARLACRSGYFYFQFGEATGSLDRAVQVNRVSDLDMKQWIGSFGAALEICRPAALATET